MWETVDKSCFSVDNPILDYTTGLLSIGFPYFSSTVDKCG